MPRVILLRHGETDHNRKGIMQGKLDVPLNHHGLRQAQLVATWLQDEQIDGVYCSNLQRAMQTAQPIADLQGCPLHTEPCIGEMDVGQWQGLTYQQAEQQYPDLWQALMKEPMYTRRPSGESFADVYERVIAWWQRVIEPMEEGCYCVVTHGVPVRSILAYTLDIDPVDFGLRISLKNTGISMLEYDRAHRRWLAHCINATCHLKARVNDSKQT
ncbi:MAG: histidine phosphatase family protein [Bacillota bacterium]